MNKSDLPLRATPLILRLLALAVLLCLSTVPASAQTATGPVQVVNDRIEAGETHAYIIRDLQAGDRITISMEATSGDLDPATAIMDTSRSIQEVQAQFAADFRDQVLGSEDVSLALTELRDSTFLAWDDDSGGGYAAALEYIIPTAGDYRVIAGSSLSALGRGTFGDYELRVGLNADTLDQPVGQPFLEREATEDSVSSAVDETTGSLTAEQPATTLRLADMEAGDTLQVYVEPVSGTLIPAVILRDFGGKGLQASNLDGQSGQAVLEYTFAERASGYTLAIQAVNGADGNLTSGDFRALVGMNAPEVMTGTAVETGGVLQKPIDVQVGIRIERISEVDSQGEDFTVLGNIRMDWQDPALAFSPDTCDCAIKLYTEKEFDRFLADVQSRWPDFVFFNQQGNRWVQSRAAAIWPDGRARYGETFTTVFQSDFDFRKFPFDTQPFPIYTDLILPADVYTLSELPDYNFINPEHGEDEFIITDWTTETSTIEGRITDNPVSRFTFRFDAPRHQNYYILQVFVPILLIILISWFTFFLHDYSRRIEASAANVLLFIAFNFSLSDNYPRLGYITFLDAVMAVTFVFNTLVLLYNVYMKRLETEGGIDRVEHIDRVLDWAYPFMYLGLIGLVALWFFVIS